VTRPIGESWASPAPVRVRGFGLSEGAKLPANWCFRAWLEARQPRNRMAPTTVPTQSMAIHAAPSALIEKLAILEINAGRIGIPTNDATCEITRACSW
jgi:hypothetical protein